MGCNYPTHSGRCDTCDYFKDHHSCALPKILVDASIILQTLEAEEKDLAEDILDDHKERHVMVVTPDILGEVLKRLSQEATSGQAQSWIGEYLPRLKRIAVITPDYDDRRFFEIFSRLKTSCRMGDRDLVHVVTSIIHGYRFLYIDGPLHQDGDTIRNILREEFVGLTYNPHKRSHG